MLAMHKPKTGRHQTAKPTRMIELSSWLLSFLAVNSLSLKIPRL
jgi:hypothetical protein